jgi:glycosyltransferase EpsF
MSGVPRILHLVTHLERGGIEMWLLSMLRRIPRAECQMDFVCKGDSVGSLAPMAMEHGANVFHCPLKADHVSFARGLTRILDSQRYHLVHNHSELYSGFPVWIARRRGTPVITSFHNVRFAPQTAWAKNAIVSRARWLYGQMSLRYALKNSELVTGCSRGVLDGLGRTEGKHSKVLYYGVEPPAAATDQQREAFRASLDLPPKCPLLLHVGRFDQQKNHIGLIDVFERVLGNVADARLILVGEGELRPVMQKCLETRGLGKNVRFLGLRDDVSWLMTLSDVFLFPSLYEGFGLVAIEAHAAGLPLVGSNVPGLVEACCQEAAFLHELRDLEGMADSVVRILASRELSQQLAHAGRAWVRERFSLEVSASRLLETYAAVLNERKS